MVVMARLSSVAIDGEPAASLLLNEYKSSEPSVFDSARFAAQTYNVPANTTVIATISMVAMTGLTASSSILRLVRCLDITQPKVGGIINIYPSFIIQ